MKRLQILLSMPNFNSSFYDLAPSSCNQPSSDSRKYKPYQGSFSSAKAWIKVELEKYSQEYLKVLRDIPGGREVQTFNSSDFQLSFVPHHLFSTLDEQLGKQVRKVFWRVRDKTKGQNISASQQEEKQELIQDCKVVPLERVDELSLFATVIDEAVENTSCNQEEQNSNASFSWVEEPATQDEIHFIEGEAYQVTETGTKNPEVQENTKVTPQVLYKKTHPIPKAKTKIKKKIVSKSKKNNNSVPLRITITKTRFPSADQDTPDSTQLSMQPKQNSTNVGALDFFIKLFKCCCALLPFVLMRNGVY